MSPTRVKCRMLRTVHHGATYHHRDELVALPLALAQQWAKGDRPAVEILPSAPGPEPAPARASRRPKPKS